MERRTITVRGLVQGIGFRPFVYRLAQRFGLAGYVNNASGVVRIEAEGEPTKLDAFAAAIAAEAPPLARLEAIESQQTSLVGDVGFRIVESERGSSDEIFISPDLAVCRHCLREMRNPSDRRYRYPFLNCTNCGPRLTIIEGAPYDRERTTMAAFPMCAACRAEYDDPTDRRFHAQPIACPVCGPQLALLDADGRGLPGDALAMFAQAILAGRIGVVKGIGGYHVVCDAGNPEAVSELRRRKHRDEKPFALMVGDLARAKRLCDIDDDETRLLQSPRAPIVLLRKKSDAKVADAVAPGYPTLGMMLPYSPLHHLLLDAVEGRPLVMTSANVSDEPIAYRDEDALRRLRGIADFFLTHNRPIRVRCEDSVTRWVAGREAPIRRSRGYAPLPLAMPIECRGPILAVGGQFKGAFALGRGRFAFVSHHLGDLDQYDAFQAFERDIGLYEELFQFQPARIAHDLHPEYASTRYALQRAGELGIPTAAVQHHHAHLASCMAEHGLTEPVIGVVFDGTGYGHDGAIWGGEFLVGDCRGVRRAAHLRYVPLPGGDQAIREPYRMTLMHLLDAGADASLLERRFTRNDLHRLTTLSQKRAFAPLTSSMGRLFDAVAALLGVRDRTSYEGQAAIELEWFASRGLAEEPFDFDLIRDGKTYLMDVRPMFRQLVGAIRHGEALEDLARRFHATIAAMISRVSVQLREDTGLNAVVLSGGVFMNGLLMQMTIGWLEETGFRVFRHQHVPCNDGGLSLGQLAIACNQAYSKPCASAE